MFLLFYLRIWCISSSYINDNIMYLRRKTKLSPSKGPANRYCSRDRIGTNDRNNTTYICEVFRAFRALAHVLLLLLLDRPTDVESFQRPPTRSFRTGIPDGISLFFILFCTRKHPATVWQYDSVSAWVCENSRCSRFIRNSAGQ